MNVVAVTGRLTRDPSIRYAAADKAVANYSLAVDYSKDETTFINCVAFDKNAEMAEKYFRKGSRVEITGRLHSGHYTDKDGRKVYYTEIVVNSQSFGETKAEAEGHRGGTAAQDDQQTAADGFMNIPDGVDEQLPFA